MPDHLYLEDLSVGQTFESGEHALGRDEIVGFAAQFDPQPFHLDESAGVNSLFGGLAASGWHTAALTMRLLVTGGLPLSGQMIGLEAHLAWPRPTYPGDVLRVTSEILEIAPSLSKSDRAIITVRSTTTNQKGETVQAMTSKIMAFRRPASDDRLQA